MKTDKNIRIYFKEGHLFTATNRCSILIHKERSIQPERVVFNEWFLTKQELTDGNIEEEFSSINSTLEGVNLHH